MKRKIILIFISVFIAVLSLFGACTSDNKNSESSGSEPTVPALEFIEKRVEILLGDTRQLSIATLNEGETVSYVSNDETIVTVDENGLIEGKGVGSTIVKATTSKERTALTQIIVHDPESYPIPSISVSQDKIYLGIGDEYKVECSYSYLGQLVDTSITMTSEDTSIVTIEDGVICAVGVGTANVVLSGSSAFGTATKRISVTVLSAEAEFYLSISGKDIYIGNNIALAIYVNENGEIKTIDGATFNVTETDVAKVENGALVPQKGGDTAVVATFIYAGEEVTLEAPIHVYGPHSCTFRYIDGELDHVTEAVYGDKVSLALENPNEVPEYRKAVKLWYANGEKVTGDVFVMPDEDVELSVRFVNETEENFVNSFTAGHLLNDISAKAEYINETFTDEAGLSSNNGGYVKFTSPTWSSLNYNFDEAIEVNSFATISIKMYLPQESALLYFGIASEENWSKQNSTKRYEAGRSYSGDVPYQVVEYEKWIILEMPLSEFVSIGEKLNGISICVSSNSYILIDYITVNHGLAAQDNVYMDNMLYNAICAEENGSQAQVNAISAYRAWTVDLSDEERASAVHQANVAAINAIIDEYFTAGEASFDNLPKVSGLNVTYTGDQVGTSFCHPNYASRVYQHYYMTQVRSSQATYEIASFNYSAYSEVSFGLFVNGTNDSTMTINQQTISLTKAKAHLLKVVIKNGSLTISYDEENNSSTLLTVELSEDVLNGTTALSFSFDFLSSTFAQLESTEMYAAMPLVKVN